MVFRRKRPQRGTIYDQPETYTSILTCADTLHPDRRKSGYEALVEIRRRGALRSNIDFIHELKRLRKITTDINVRKEITSQIAELIKQSKTL